MVILDPDREGCVVWLVNSPIIRHENNVTCIKGDTIEEICKSLIRRLAGYKDIKNQWGNTVTIPCWQDDVYLDISGLGVIYKDVFNNYGLDVIDIRGKNADVIVPERCNIYSDIFRR